MPDKWLVAGYFLLASTCTNFPMLSRFSIGDCMNYCVPLFVN